MPTLTDAKNDVAANVPDSDVPASDAAPKAEKPKREPKAKPVPTDCGCQVPTHGKNDKYPGCNGAKTTSRFAPGHDAKLSGYLNRQVESGDLTAEMALDIMKERSNNSALLVGKLQKALAVTADKATRKAKAEAEKAAKSEAPADSTTPEAQVDAEAAASV